MRLQGVLFDLDGTLADTEAAERRAWPALAALLRSHAPEADPVELQRRYDRVFAANWADYLEGRVDFTTYRRRRLTEALAPWREVDDGLFETYRLEKRRAVETLELFPGAVEAIRSLREHGLRVGLLTNGPSVLQRRKLAVTGLAAELEAIAISEEIGAAKPAREAFELAAGLLGCELRRTAMVGDSLAYDIAGALAAGLAAAVLVGAEPGAAPPGATAAPSLAAVPDALSGRSGGRGRRR
ncbi:MAG: HAD family hydrolase [Thermoleophilia bacterium]|nr:HAD family hydrolase [Thermoleophilia bacterium]